MVGDVSERAVEPLQMVKRTQLLAGSFDGIFESALKLVVVLNASDAVMTSWWVATGLATEANPLMARVLEHGISAFLATKLFIGLAAVAVFRAHSKHFLSRTGVAAVLVAYIAIFVLHLTHGALQWSETGSLFAMAP
jgi:hypothetical protein